MTIEQDDDRLINNRLRQKPAPLKLTPRSYQTEFLRKVLQENTIVYLGTGLGKTFIVVMFLNHPKIDQQIRNKRKVVFLATSRDLLKQQAEYINNQVPYRVKVYCGGSGLGGQHIDNWMRSSWQNEFQVIDILFIMPQIFVAALTNKLIDWSQISSVIFDECHNAASKSKGTGSPYKKILEHYQEHYSKLPDSALHPRPRIIGLTASLVNDMPKSTTSEYVREEVINLERMFSAKCVTDLQVRETKPRIVVQKFSSSNLTSQNDLLLNLLEQTEILVRRAIDEASVKNRHNKHRGGRFVQNRSAGGGACFETAYERILKLAAIGFSIKPEDFAPIFKDLAKIRCEYGLWILSSICQKLMEALESSNSYQRTSNFIVSDIYKDFVGLLKKIRNHIDEFLATHAHGGLMQQTSSKPKALLHILESEAERAKSGAETTFSCVIFVENRLEVIALSEWLQQVSDTHPERYGFIKCSCAIGLAGAQTCRYACVTRRTPSKQAEMLQDFREGTLNVIVTTAVLEEGIDLPVCSSVIRYDIVQNFRQHVQSRGRARQAISSFILMCEERDYAKMMNNLRKFNEFELTVKETLRSNDIRSSSRLEYLRTIDTNNSAAGNERAASSASMKPTSVLRSILERYLSFKSKQTPFTGGLRFERYGGPPNSFQTKLFFPYGCPLSNGIEGLPKKSKKAADNSALIAAIDALHATNELDENEVPTWLETRCIDTFLAGSNLEPKFDKLDDHLEGVQLKTVDKDCKLKVRTYFKPCVDVFKSLCLSRDIENRTYKLLRISYKADLQKSRIETRSFLEESVFGLILDSKTSCDFIPSVLYSHYGQVEVRTQEILSDFKMTLREDHCEFLSFTHKMLSRCLLFNDLPIEDFNCLFYLVILSKDNQLDLDKMRKSFGEHDIERRVELQPGDVVRVGARGSNQSEDDGNHLMLVRKVLHDLSIDSMTSSGLSYRQRAEKRFGNSITIRSEQPRIEVMRISMEFARFEQGKESRMEYKDQSWFYIEQELELFDSDASCVLQASMKPAIIHSLFLQTIASELDKKLSSKPSTTHLVGRQLENEAEKICNNFNSSTHLNYDESPKVGVEDENSDADSTISNDVNFADIIAIEAKSRINIDGDHDNDDIDFVDDKQMEDIQQQPLHKAPEEEILYYANPDLQLESRAQTAQLFQRLSNEIELDRLGFVAKLSNFDLRSINIRLTLEESALFNRWARVDKSVKPPIKFDRNQKPLKEATRSRSLLEALTFSRAQGGVNYECLENIGDSFIKQVVSMVLFSKTDGDEGFLTSARSRLIANKYFTHLAKKNGLGSYAITHPFGKDQLAFLMGKDNHKTLPNESGSNSSAIVETNYNRMDSKNLADLVESIVGSRLIYHGEYEAMRTIQALGLNIFDNSMFKEFNKEAVVFSRCPTALSVSSLPADSFESDYQALKMRLDRFEEVLNYKFNDISHLIQALTHSSAITKYTLSYERLEFIGDSLLDYLVTIHLATFGSKSVREDPGQITTSRSALVNNYFFAKLALKYTFDLFISHGTYSILDSMNKVHAAMEKDPEMHFLDVVEYDDIVKLLGDVFESVAGAIYLDSGNSLDTLWSVYYPMMKEFIEAEIENPTKNLVAELHESFPCKKGVKRVVFNYYATEKRFEEHLTRAVCTIVGYRSFEGKGLTKRQAKLRAVKQAMDELPDRATRDQLNRKFNQDL